MSFALKLLGGIAIEGDGGPVTGPATQRHRLALLAVLAVARGRGVSRDKLQALLWPERDPERARQLLNQAVHVLRRVLGGDTIRSAGDDLVLDVQAVECDVALFEQALERADPAPAIARYAGPFLDGFYLRDAPEFERWVERERDRLSSEYGGALETLANEAEGAGDSRRAVEWWSARAAHEPYDTGVALRLIQALERASNRAGALQHALKHERVLREDLSLEPAPALSAAIRRLRREPPADYPVPPARPARPTTAAADPLPAASPPARPPRPRRLGLASALTLAAVAVLAATWLLRRSGGPAPTGLVEDRIAKAVVHELDRHGQGDSGAGSRAAGTRSIAAYELYLRGNDPATLRSDTAARRGLDEFRRAVGLDSTFAAAWAGLARLTLRVAEDVDLEAAAAMRVEGEAAARRAIALDDSLADGHAMLGLARSIAYDFPEAEAHFRRALALEPRRARIKEWVVDFYLATGRRAEALVEAEAALALDSLSPSATAEVARALLASDRCDEALAHLARLAALDPPLARAAPIAAQCYARLGRWAEGIAQLRPQADRGDHLSLALLGYLLGRAGQREQALAIQAGLEERWRHGAIGARYLAIVPTGLGDRDRVFAWLDRARTDRAAGRFPGLRVSLADPVFEDLRDDPRLARLRRPVGLPPR